MTGRLRRKEGLAQKAPVVGINRCAEAHPVQFKNGIFKKGDVLLALALFKSPSRGGVNKNGVSSFLTSIGHFFFVRSNCWGR